MNACKLTSQALAKEIVGLPVQATVIQMKECLLLHKNNVRKQYKDKGFESSTVNFWDTINDERQTFFSVCKVDNNLLYASCSTENDTVAVATSLDRVCMRGSIQRVFFYGVHWRTVSTLCIVSGKMSVVASPGIKMIDLANAVKGSGIIFSDPANHKIYRLSSMISW